MASHVDRDKVIRDPVHNLIRLPRADKSLLLKILDTAEMQRLRRIRQLGLGCLTYPGAEHSRFAHSLGVFHVARRMIDALKRHHDRQTPEIEALDNVRREILVAALLHDVGHGPFSHLFESALPRPESAPKEYPDDHEAWSRRIVKEQFSKLSGDGVNVDLVVDLLDKKSRNNLLAKDFVSSQLDADRLDFLQRDRHAAGVKYGAFDMEWILNVIRVGNWRAPGSATPQWRLCYLEVKSVPAIMEFLLARAYLYRELYIHKTTRAYEAVFHNILARASWLAKRGALDPVNHSPFQKLVEAQVLATAEYLSLDDFRVWGILADWARESADKTLKELCSRLTDRGRPFQHIRLDNRLILDAVSLLKDLEHEESLLSFRCYLDRFETSPYKDAFGDSVKEDEERQYRSILLLDAEGNVRPAGSDEWIKQAPKIKVEESRLYYDDEDEGMTGRLRKEGLLS